MNQELTAPEIHEIITKREQFYTTVSFDTHYVFCFDERKAAEAEASASTGTSDSHKIEIITPEEYIHWAGGGLSPSYNLAIMDEVTKPGSVTGSFESHTETFTPALIKAGVRVGVHSDVDTEAGKHVHPDPDGDVGCGYAQLRQPISWLIAERGEEVVADAATLRPELFDDLEDTSFAFSVVNAHQRLAERDSFFTNGRRVVLTATANGAKMMLVKDKHVADKGIINLVPGTSIRSGDAHSAGLPVYNQDSWAAEEANARISHLHPYDTRQQQIAELIDTIGTMRALGVKEIAVRRPEDLAQAA